MPKEIENVACAWVIYPAPWRVNAPPTLQDQEWIMILNGVVDINFTGTSATQWVQETFYLDLDWLSPVRFAYGQAVPTGM